MNDTRKTKIEVSAGPLIQIIKALTGPAHHIREIQAIRGLPGTTNPIDTLIDEINAQKDELNDETLTRNDLTQILLACIAQLETYTDNDLIIGYDGASFNREELKQTIIKGHS